MSWRRGKKQLEYAKTNFQVNALFIECDCVSICYFLFMLAKYNRSKWKKTKSFCGLIYKYMFVMHLSSKIQKYNNL